MHTSHYHKYNNFQICNPIIKKFYESTGAVPNFPGYGRQTAAGNSSDGPTIEEVD